MVGGEGGAVDGGVSSGSFLVEDKGRTKLERGCRWPGLRSYLGRWRYSRDLEVLQGWKVLRDGWRVLGLGTGN